MDINIVLGNTIDSLIWVKKLEAEGEGVIMILDYNLREDVFCENDIVYISPEHAKKIAENTSSVRFFKSMYVFPGMYESID